jgi:hypothetical protein
VTHQYGNFLQLATLPVKKYNLTKKSYSLVNDASCMTELVAAVCAGVQTDQ